MCRIYLRSSSRTMLRLVSRLYNYTRKGRRRQPNIYADMDRLKARLLVLLDESKPIQDRLDEIADKSGSLYIRGLGRAVLTPILMCVYPDKYAVYNQISEEGLNWLGRNTARSSDSFGKRYVAINEACHQIADEIKQPLSLFDSMFSLMVHGVDSPLGSATPPESGADGGEDAGIAPVGAVAVSESLVKDTLRISSFPIGTRPPLARP